MRLSCRTTALIAVLALVSLPALYAGAPNEQELARQTIGPSAIEWQPLMPWSSIVLTVLGPEEISLTRVFRPGESLLLRLSDFTGEPLQDGQYTYTMSFEPVIDAATRATLQDARARNDNGIGRIIRALRRSEKLPAEPRIYSGSFVIRDGSIVPPDLAESGGGFVASSSAPPGGFGSDAGSGTATLSTNGIRPFDQLIPDDLIVQGSGCFGLDCVLDENFGFDTIRLKENSTRIKFDDTSGVGFPSDDWQLTANDSASGGLNKFSIDNVTAGRIPFTILGGAPTNSLFVSGTGKLGLRTSAPLLDVHIRTGDTPAHRLEQDSTIGYTAQTWDIAGNEANFFVRDVTGGSRLPFRIRPGAPTSSIDISAIGRVGLGTAGPTASLHLFRADGTAGLLIEEATTTAGPRDLLTLRNNGRAMIRLTNSATGVSYVLSGPGLTFPTLAIYDPANPAATKVAIGSTVAASRTLEVTGDVLVTGTIIGNLSNMKAGIIAAASFTGSPASATVSFSSAFPDANYAVVVTPVSSGANLIFNVRSKSASGFTVATAQPTAGLLEVDWIATRVTP